MDRRIGAQFYTIRDFCKTLNEFEESCRKVSEIGYKTVQLSGIGDFAASDVKRILDKYSLECVCTHKPAKQFEENIESLIAWHKEIDCSIAGLGGFFGSRDDAKGILDFVQKYNDIADKLYDNGITFAYHNHQFEFASYGDKNMFEIIAENTDADKFKFILDVFWLAYAGITPAAFIRKYGNRVACVHFKDMGVIGREINMFEVGHGNLDWDDIITACEEKNIKYALVEQDICRRDPFESLKMSYDYLCGKGLN